MTTFSCLVDAARESLLRTGVQGPVLVGLSGGADSVALLLALHALRQTKDLSVFALYVNHGLRQSARTEEEFCRSLCERLEIPFSVRRVCLPPGQNVEAAAREARYAALFAEMREREAKTVALAHHADDQAETVLMHLLYGAGADGLSAMPEYRAPVWRPFLKLRRSDIREALRAAGESWREDESNADERITRNRIRARIIPSMEKIYPRAVEAMGRAADILRDENECLNELARDAVLQICSAGEWPFLLCAPLLRVHRAMQRRIVKLYAEKRGLALDFAQTEALLALLNGPPGGKCNLPQGWKALRTDARLHLIPPAEKKRPYVWPASCLSIREYDGWAGDGKTQQAVPAELLKDAELRTKRPGDFIRPFGMQGRMKLKDYLISRGIDPPFRQDWPLLCVGSEALWAIGAGASESLRIKWNAEDCRLLAFTGTLPDAIEIQEKREGKRHGT